jgi:hypothetical protein
VLIEQLKGLVGRPAFKLLLSTPITTTLQTNFGELELNLNYMYKNLAFVSTLQLNLAYKKLASEDNVDYRFNCI